MVAYLRVSTSGQSVDSQRLAIERSGFTIQREFVDSASGARADRQGLGDLLVWVREGDVVVTYSLSRLSRSTRDLLGIIEQLEAKGAQLVSVTEAIDTATPAGRLLITVLSSIAAFERETLVDRTKAGLDVARAKGRRLGRPPTDAALVREVERLRAQGMSAAAACREVGIGRATYYAHAAAEKSHM
ncbi:DNA invertase Pin-like site-specific DNA recombinase [Luteococcus japonicus]|uniref:DNA invertase Pin-like site-specific DNA recombinase n=1 Tax=Luteococcus japonicus TaxID=33984 RepID=A0A3N1ZXA8_9ACTN|nr:DNA invertase Pin-like site-specific DNA recombinase [Luteococcus japonicus]